MKGELSMKVRISITAKMAKRYRKATKKEKGVILDSLVEVTGFNRSYLSRRLRTYTPRPSAPYQRVLESPYVEESVKEELRKRYDKIDLYQLRMEIIRLINRLYRSVRRKVGNVDL